jgi:Tannase and feruloyl esterase
MQSAPLNGINYYKSVVEKLGRAGVDSFMRFFVTPGANHGGAGVSSVDGAALPQGADLLDAIDGWVDRGIAPGPLVQVAQESKPPFAVTASRPLCRYPQWLRCWAARRRTPQVVPASAIICAAQSEVGFGSRLKGSQRAYRVRRTPMTGRNVASQRFLVTSGPGRVKTGSDLVAKPCGARIPAFIRSPCARTPQKSWCAFTAQSFHPAWPCRNAMGPRYFGKHARTDGADPLCSLLLNQLELLHHCFADKELLHLSGHRHRK